MANLSRTLDNDQLASKLRDAGLDLTPEQFEREMRENSLVTGFLGGRFSRTPDSDKEREARKLLASRCRSGKLEKSVLWQLAALFDPDPSPKAVWQLVIKPRRKRLPHRARDWRNAKHVAGLKELRRKEGMKEIVNAVGEMFDVSKETVYRAWREYGDKAKAEIKDGPGPVTEEEFLDGFLDIEDVKTKYIGNLKGCLAPQKRKKHR